MFKLLIRKICILFGVLSCCLMLDKHEHSKFYGSLMHSRKIRQANFTCGPFEEPCNTGEQCIESERFCDGIPDCIDYSDESGEQCLGTYCQPYAFQCTYGACISGDDKCNGKFDCFDESDEIGCPKNRSDLLSNKCGDDFTCNDGQCISQSKVCNGQPDCDDRSDETFQRCSKTDCGALPQCKYGACIGIYAKCDQIYDCIDGSDENNCEWLRKLDPSDKCKLLNMPRNGYYLVNNTSFIESGNEVRVDTKIKFYCDKEYKLSGSDEMICIRSGVWYKNYPKCLKTCPPKFDYSLEVKCQLNGIQVNCSEPAIENTMASLKCKDHYYFGEKGNRDLREYSKVICRSGTWNPEIFRCIPECGNKNIDTGKVDALVIGSSFVTNVTKYPWHVGIFKKFGGKRRFKWIQACGGSIIRSNVVLTAAHCFNATQPELYAVAAAKIARKWDAPEDKYAQHKYVKEIKIREMYKGRARNFAHDIALVILKDHFDFNQYVLPVCTYRAKNVILTGNSVGSVAGWGLTETGSESTVLKDLDLPYIPFDSCKENLNNELFAYYTDDKFCAGRNDGQVVCKGDSGGGFALLNPSDNLHYVVGVVSVSELERSNKIEICDRKLYTLFTNVSYHIDFIDKTLNELIRFEKESS